MVKLRSMADEGGESKTQRVDHFNQATLNDGVIDGQGLIILPAALLAKHPRINLLMQGSRTPVFVKTGVLDRVSTRVRLGKTEY